MSRHRLPDADETRPTAEPAPIVPAPRVVADSCGTDGRSSAPRRVAPHTAPAEPGAPTTAERIVGGPRAHGRPADAAAPRGGNATPARSGSHRVGAAPARRRHRRDPDNREAARRLPRLGGSRRSALVLLAVAVGIVALPTAGSAAVDQCRWQVAAHELFVSLDGQTDSRSTRLRKALQQAGVGQDVPAECAGATSGAAPTVKPASKPAPKPRPTSKPTAAPTTTTAAAPAASTGSGTTAAQVFGWGTPTKSDDFSAGLSQWGLYDGAGHDGNGRRTPSAISTANGIMTITGSGGGASGGMAWGQGQKYGRWEARVRSAPGDNDYHPVILLWPDAENWPVGGEVDWMEISDPNRQSADTFLHYGRSNNQVQGSVKVDATQWHNWAVEWTPKGITTYLDGKAWWSTTNTSILPPGPMHMTIQLDNFGGSGLKPSQMQVDWARQYKA